MELYKEYEITIKKLFQNEDRVIATILQEALDGGSGKDLNIYSTLAWASGNLKSRLPSTAEVLFQFVQTFKYGVKKKSNGRS